MKTLLLDNTYWDLLADAAGNIAVASEPYAFSQDVASALKLFLAECWFDTSRGIPYFETVLGQTPPIAYFQELMVRAALTVPGVASAQCTIESFENRTVTGQVTFRTTTGLRGTVSI